jgi:Tol biopolymer transport system component
VALRQPARIVFAAVDHPQGRTGLFTVEPDGRDVKPLGSLHPLWAVWSPDGSRMAVQLERKIVLADARAQVQRPLADGGEPSWSPGGREIAFETGGPALTAVIVIMDVDTGEQRELGPGAHASWAPDGERVVAGRNDGALWVYRLDGGPAERLTDVRDDASPCPVSATQPAWSPDGATIAYVDDGCSSFVLRFLDVASRTTLPYRGNSDALEPEEVAPAWSPDGRYVVYQQGGFSEWGKIAVVRADGSGYRVLYAGPGESTSPSWAPR